MKSLFRLALLKASYRSLNFWLKRPVGGAQLLQQSNLALNLAQTPYNIGLGSIVELSQAQLQQTQAEISNTQAGYEYRLALAVLRFQTANY